MKSFIVKSSDLSPNRDNPYGQWSVDFHSVRTAAIRLAKGIACDPGEYNEAAICRTVKDSSQRRALQNALRNAPSKEAICKIILDSIKVFDPSGGLLAGVQDISRRIAHENALRITREALDLLRRAKTLKS